jgi:hypothetical protein
MRVVSLRLSDTDLEWIESRGRRTAVIRGLIVRARKGDEREETLREAAERVAREIAKSETMKVIGGRR